MRSSPHAAPRRLLLLNLVLVFLLGLFAARLPSTLAQISGRADPMDLVYDTQRLLMTGFVDKPDPQKLANGAITGMLESLDDKYAEYVPAEDAADFEKNMTGSFFGIGCQLDPESKDKWLTVQSPMEDSPAFNAGILAGDRILKIDGKSTFEVPVDKCIKMITGAENTVVHLDVLRNGQELHFDLTRARIVSKSARGFRRLPDGSGHWDHLIDPENKIAYVRLAQFTPTVPQELTDALAQAAKAAGVEPDQLGGLILDLRGNPGGLMDAAIEIVDMFVDEGRIMSTKGRNTPEIVYNAEKSAHTPRYPIAVLVNGNSASASEIVAGSLSDNKRAIVIGSRTYGKGLVQTVANLPHDPRASIKFTAQHYYLPSGRMIQRDDKSTEWGVDPTPGFFLPITREEEFTLALKRRAWDILRKDGTTLPAGTELPPGIADQHWTDPEWITSAAKDKQLAGAVKTMHAKVAQGEWAHLNEETLAHSPLPMAEMKNLEKTRDRLFKEITRIEKRLEVFDEVASTGIGDSKIPDLWPNELDLTDGLVEVKDKSGKVIADLRITGRDLEYWLSAADIKPIVPVPPADSGSASAKPPEEKKQ